MNKKFCEEQVIKNLVSLCKNNRINLPCELDSWHGFDSSKPESLLALGQHLQKQGWRFVGIWPLHHGSDNFHLRVSRTGTYEEVLLLDEMKKMEKLSAKFDVDGYSDCSPQPHQAAA